MPKGVYRRSSSTLATLRSTNAEYQKLRTESAYIFKLCESCGKDFRSRTKLNRLFCSKRCKSLKQFEHIKYKGGSITNYGYRVFGGTSSRVSEHKLVVEHYLGRKLTKNEVVHHINHNKLDNRIDNLIVLTRSFHNVVHNFQTRTRGANGRFVKSNT